MRAVRLEFLSELFMDPLQHLRRENAFSDAALIAHYSDTHPGSVQPGTGFRRPGDHHEFPRMLHIVRTVLVEHTIPVQQHQPHCMRPSTRRTV
jgi:hypothetical protein